MGDRLDHHRHASRRHRAQQALQMILEFERVSHQRGRTVELDDVSFGLPEGASLGVLASRDRARTSLVELAIGASWPDRGRVRRRGRMSMPIGAPATLHRLMTGREIATVTAGLYGADAGALVRFVTGYAELGAVMDRPFGLFNAVQRSRFVFILSWAIPADCYVADGALFSGLDPAFRERSLALAHARRKQASLFFTTEAPRDLRLFADCGAILKDGRLRLYPSVDAAIADFGDTPARADSAPALPEETADDEAP
jgi:capsular polysaccharide transport system ATP-binding protein